MYRYSADQSVTYSPGDLVLFRESPFAAWMERLSLENPEHGIPPDTGSQAPHSDIHPAEDMARTLRMEGRGHTVIDWQLDEATRRRNTLDAMRQGVDFIVDAQVALGPLSGTANMLVRTSGFSDLGSYLYLPCDTQGGDSPVAVFRLCFLADLLHSLQGQLPPQLLRIHTGADVVPLSTEDHIYHYRAVKHRFMTAMREFRKHRMPDPAESAQFGRWSECANEVLRQRALRSEERAFQVGEPAKQPDAGDLAADETLSAPRAPSAAGAQAPMREQAPSHREASPGGTLAEQAQQLDGSAPPSDLAPLPAATPTGRVLDSMFLDLEFIGSNGRDQRDGKAPASPAVANELAATEAPEAATERVEVIPETLNTEPGSSLAASAELAREPMARPEAIAASSRTESSPGRKESQGHPLDSTIDVSASLPDAEAAVSASPEHSVPDLAEIAEGGAPADSVEMDAPPARERPVVAKNPRREPLFPDDAPISSSLITSEDLYGLGTDPLQDV